MVKLDPRLRTTQVQLQQRFALLMRIQNAINRLDISLNHAIDARAALKQAISDNRISKHVGQHALASLNQEIDALVDLRIQSDEGSLVYPGKLRAWLSWLTSDVSASLFPPTPAMIAAAKKYIAKEREGVARLRTDVASAKAMLR